MPIYAYKCESCGHAKDVLQKMSDDPLSVCPACGQPSFRKQVTAAGFQLKGSGWYVTDFRGGNTATAPAAAGAAPAAGSADKPASETAAAPTAVPTATPAPAATPAPSAGAAPTI
jgi:putative FmdB family regulatory protein